jgi:hypothetical protein
LVTAAGAVSSVRNVDVNRSLWVAPAWSLTPATTSRYGVLSCSAAAGVTFAVAVAAS